MDKKDGLKNLTDKELIMNCLDGRRECFDELVARYHRPVYGFILKRVYHTQAVEDLVQETFLQAYKSLKNCAKPEYFSTWLFSIARNHAGKWLRRRQIEEQNPRAMEQNLEKDLEEQKSISSAVDNTIGQLPEDTQKLLRLKHWEGKSCDEIAKILNRPIGTVMSQLSRAYKALRSQLGPLLRRSHEM
jgi:RNA polymerase sigma-70 factor (ECF subfamily)